VLEYEDHDSGGKSDRPQFKTMMADATQRKFEAVLFWTLERFSREGPYETHIHLKRLDDAGVRFRSFRETYLDTCGIFRDAVISILATIARQERVHARRGFAPVVAETRKNSAPVLQSEHHHRAQRTVREPPLGGR
jgi:DNA invertase Pin-like site-specific DNA recombinase